MRQKRIKSALCLLLASAILFQESGTARADRSVSQIQKDVNEVKEDIENLDAELYQVVLAIAELNDEITTLEAEIEDTKEALDDITAACNEQYESMKVRIQYMYEAKNESVFVTLLGADSISEMLNRFEYVNDVYSYDRDKLEQFQALQQEMKELKEALEIEETELAAAKAESQKQKATLSAMLDNKKSELSDLQGELKKAKEKARKEAERKAREAAARRAAQRSNSQSNVNGDLNPAQTTSISGSSVVSYANQFVGNRYVWGGNSLTNGCDCSGFVQQVYKNYGITWSGRMTSVTFRTVGQEVSYKHMQPGDIVCYSGHVAIYAGGGKIVEAQSVATGITNYRSVDCHTILAIRRVI